MYKLILCVVSCYVIGAKSAAAPFITPCKFGDDVCLIKSSQAAVPYFATGIPDLSVLSTDPLIIDEVNGDNGELKLTFKDMTVKGLGKCKFISASLPDKVNLEFVIECPIDAVGKYTVGGKLTVFPIEGDGDFEIKTDRIQLEVKIQFKEENDRWVIDSFDFTYDPVERFYFKFENLFNGNQEKAKPVLDILNISWREVILEVGRPMINEIVERVKSNIVKFFEAVPSAELYIA